MSDRLKLAERIKDDWHLYLPWIVQLAAFVFWMGQSTSRLDGRIDRNSENITEIQKAAPQEVRWELNQQKAIVADLKTKQDSYLIELGKVGAKVDQLDLKLSYLVERQKEREVKP